MGYQYSYDWVISTMTLQVPCRNSPNQLFGSSASEFGVNFVRTWGVRGSGFCGGSGPGD